MGRRRSFVGPLLLIGIGLLLLYSSLRSNWASWEVIWRYWPVLLIGWGLGKLLDHLRHREGEAGTSPARFSGGEIGMVVALIVLLGLALTRKPARQTFGEYHFTRTVALQGAKTVHAEIEIGAGDLDVSGGAPGLLEADCVYNRPSLKPGLSYRVADGDGSLRIRQPHAEHVHFGSDSSDWRLRLGNQVPLDLDVKMGVGTGRLRLSGLQISHLSVKGGVGTLSVDLRGDWKQGFDGNIEGGVGTVNVWLPRDVGVRVHARAGLGSVNAPGFRHEGHVYFNKAYGKSPVSIQLDVAGGVGTVNLEPAS